MVKVVVFFACAVVGAFAAPPFVWDIIKAPLKTEEVFDIIYNAVPGESFPIYAAVPEGLDFDCAKQNFAGYYADVSTKCQVFHRCDLSGVRTSYLCPNTTIFDQIRLVCDYFFNVDCVNGAKYVDFVNSRFHTDKDAFDTPPADYVVPWERESRILMPDTKNPEPAPKPAVKPVPVTPVKPTAKVVVVKPAGTTPKPAAPVTEGFVLETPEPTNVPAAETTQAPSEPKAEILIVSPPEGETTEAPSTEPKTEISIASTPEGETTAAPSAEPKTEILIVSPPEGETTEAPSTEPKTEISIASTPEGETTAAPSAEPTTETLIKSPPAGETTTVAAVKPTPMKTAGGKGPVPLRASGSVSSASSKSSSSTSTA